MTLVYGKYSEFPKKLDNFKEMFDLPANKVRAAQRRSKLLAKVELNNDEQNELNTINAELREYIISAVDWNKFGSSVYSLQKFFRDNVEGYLEDKQLLWLSYIENFSFVGNWKVGTSYEMHNMVFVENGDLYMCLRKHTATQSLHPMDNSRYWGKVSNRGKQGEPFMAVNYKGEWRSQARYSQGDAVTYVSDPDQGGIIYFAKKANTNERPSAQSTAWQLYTKVYSGKKEPMDAMTGLHYIRILD